MAVVIESGVGAFAGSIYNGRDDVTFAVDDEKSVLGNLGSSLRAHQLGINRIALLKIIQFRLFQRGAAVADYAATALADWIIAGKIFSDNFFGDENVPYLDYGSEFIPQA